MDQLVKEILSLFDNLSAKCPHKNQNDCGHPTIDFDCMVCAPCNCPLLLEEAPA